MCNKLENEESIYTRSLSRWKEAELAGQTFALCVQEFRDTCGPAAICTLIHQIEEEKVPEAAIRTWLDREEDQLLALHRALSKTKPGMGLPAKIAPREFPRFGTVAPGEKEDASDESKFIGGTTLMLMLGVLRKRYPQFRAQMSCNPDDISPECPAIVRVQEPERTLGHFSVCLGELSKGEHAFLDPWAGPIKQAKPLWPIYNAPKFVAAIDDDFILTRPGYKIRTWV